MPDKLPPPAVCVLPGFRKRRGEAALDEPPGRGREAFLGDCLGDCWGVDSKKPFDCALNDFFKGELRTGYTNLSLAHEVGMG